MKLNDALSEYLVDLSVRNYTPKTINVYRCKMTLFLRYCAKQGINDLEDLRVTHVKSFASSILERGKKASYANSMCKTIKAFVQWAYEEDYGGWNTRDGKWPTIKKGTTKIPTFTPDQVRKILKSCKGNGYLEVRDRCIITVFVDTGVRAQELCSIKPEDVHDTYILIHGKGRKERIAAITDTMRREMLRYDRARASFFQDKFAEDCYFLSIRGHALCASTLKCLVKKRCEGISGVRCCPHDFRHFFAAQQIKNGTDIYTLCTMLGHSSVNTTAIYASSLSDEDYIKMAQSRSVLKNM